MVWQATNKAEQVIEQVISDQSYFWDTEFKLILDFYFSPLIIQPGAAHKQSKQSLTSTNLFGCYKLPGNHLQYTIMLA